MAESINTPSTPRNKGFVKRQKKLNFEKLLTALRLGGINANSTQGNLAERSFLKAL